MLPQAPTSRHSAPGKSGALARSLFFSLGTQTDTPLSFQIYRLRFTLPCRWIPQRRWGEVKWILEESAARLGSRVCRGAEGRASCQQKRKVSIQIKLDAGKFNIRSAFRINFISFTVAGRLFFKWSSNEKWFCWLLLFLSVFTSETKCFMQLVYTIF